MSTGTVRTVLGDLAPERLGVCDSHDHLFFGSPLLPGQELDDPDAASAELAAFEALGGRAVVQWTPYGMGRRIGALRSAARASGVAVVAATGLHQAAHYHPTLVDKVRDGLAALFVEELTVGIRERPDGEPGESRAGLVKVAGEFHALPEHARREPCTARPPMPGCTSPSTGRPGPTTPPTGGCSSRSPPWSPPGTPTSC
jgi:phosphotriesterase-related protein